MTTKDVIDMMMQNQEKYTTYEEREIPIRMMARPCKGRRKKKKSIKLYGYITRFKRKQCRVIGITLNDVIQYCIDNNLPVTHLLD